MGKLLFHIVSGQTAPVYVAVKTIKPDKNIFLYTSSSVNELNNIKNTLTIPFDTVKVEGFQFNSITKSLEYYIDNLSGENELILNFTGGTKIQSIACYEYFRKKRLEALYVNGEDSEIIRIHPNGKISTEKINIKIPPATYIMLQGQSIRSKEIIQNETEIDRLAVFLSWNFNTFSKFILNFARTYDAKRNVIPKYINSGKLSGCKIVFSNGKTEISLVRNGKQLFSSSTLGRELLEFIAGRWLEVAVYKKLIELNCFDTIEMSLRINWKDQNLNREYGKNEIDIFAMQGTYPYIFEIKTGSITTAAVDKLIPLKRSYLGRYSSLYIISWYKPQGPAMEKMRDHNIRHLSFKNIKSLFLNIPRKNPNLK